MIANVILGILLILCAVWATAERVSAGRARAASRSEQEAAGHEREAATVAIRGVELELEAARAAQAEAAHAILARDALLDVAKASAARAYRDSEAALERARTQETALKRTLAGVSAERDRLAKSAADHEDEVASAEALADERLALQSRLQAAEAELTHLRNDTARSPTRLWAQRMAELQAQCDELRADAGRWETRGRQAEQALDNLESAAASADREALRVRLARLEEDAARSARANAAVASLGLPEFPRDAKIYAADRRGRTEAILRETYISTQSAAAAIYDGRGASWARCGNLTPLERLAATTALLAGAPVSHALGGPPRLASELFGVYGRHIVALGGGLVLGVTASRECPVLPLRLAALKLTGPNPALPAEGATPPILPLDADRSEQLDAWASRRGAQGVALFGHGDPAASRREFAAACAPLVPVVRSLFSRALRDGFGHGFAIVWRAGDDVTLVARVLEDGASVVLARFAAPPAMRVVDDLVATVRWAPTPQMVA